MSERRALVYVWLLAAVFCSAAYAVQPDRVTGDLTSGPKVMIKDNVHGLARPEFDQGRADESRLLPSMSIDFHPSAAQQKALDLFLSQLADPNSKNYHKYLTPAQFADRYGMSPNDIQKVVTWLQSEGFTNITVSPNRNRISFDGTIAQVESVFSVEMHKYLVNGEMHLANANSPSLPEGLAGAVLGIEHLHDFAPKARARIQSHLTSYVSGNHFLTPADFATIYDLGPLYSAGATGSGQKIAVVGQSTVSTTDLNNFRSRAGLAASTVTMTMVPGGTATKCSGDEGESDLDIEWSGGVAKNASITFVFAPVSSGATCTNRTGLNVWDALNYAVVHNVAPFISTSYGFCESGVGTFANTVQSWAQQAVSQGQTIVAASGDSGAADCELAGSTSASSGLQVDVPASIPEVTGAGGNEFTGDAAATVTGSAPNTTAGATPYWGASGTGSDVISTALSYIPEEAWNDTAQSNAQNPPGGLAASGGGASTMFGKPSWQTGTGVPADGHRDVPDISISASNFHDPYLVCSEDFSSTSCSVGFRESSGGSFSAVGGTSAAAPTFAGILALINQYVGNPGTKGFAPVNPILYQLAASNPSAFHDVKTGDNKVPCTAGTADCPTGTTSIGYSTGTGYDQVTGLGSVDGFNLAQAYAATLPGFSVGAGSLNPSSVPAGSSTTTTITFTPQNGFAGTITPSCSGLPSGATCTFNPTTVSGGSGSTTLTIQTAANTAAGTSTVTVKGTSGAITGSTTVSLNVTATSESFTLSSSTAGSTVSVAQGQVTSAINITVTSTSTPSFVQTNGSGSTTALPLTYSCTGLPVESTCLFSPGQTSSNPTITLTIQTTAPTARMLPPLGRGTLMFYAMLLPGLLGIVFTASARKRPLRDVRLLGLVLVIGLSSLWMASCSGSSGSGAKNFGTPTGSSTVTVNATTGGSAPLTNSFQFTLTVTP
jgi:subtilase family serine protease